METLELCARLGTALALGAIIGLERQLRQGLGGIRVYTLVSFGSALFVLSGALAPDHDYSRMASQAITGIGFLCAGMIFKHGISVRGLNQAATIWSTSAVGVLAGSGFLIPALLGTFGILFVHLVMRSFSQELEQKLLDNSSDLHRYVIEAECDQARTESVRILLSTSLTPETPVRLVGFSSEGTDGNRKVTAEYVSTVDAEDEMQHIIGHVAQDEKVRAIRWRKVPHENGRD